MRLFRVRNVRLPSKSEMVTIALLGLIGLVPLAFAQERLQIADGLKVTIEYSVVLPDKTVADSTVGREPYSYIHGQNQISPVALERSLMGLKVGENKRIPLTASEAYGAYDERKKVRIPKAKVPPGTKVGSLLHSQDGLQARVVAVGDDAVVLDTNHPLAGKNLVFDVKILRVEKPVEPK